MWLFLMSTFAAAGPLPDGVTISVHPSKPTFVIGEAEWMVLVVDNRGTAPFVVSMTTDPKEGHASVALVDAAGDPAPSPFPHPRRDLGDDGPYVEVPPGQRGELRFDLARFAWLDAPGTWTVRVSHTVDSPFLGTLADDRQTTARVTVVAPEDDRLDAIVRSHPIAFGEPFSLAEDGYESLGHARYVPVLERLVLAARPPEDIAPDERGRWMDERALHGLAACPCTAATEALLRLLAHPEPELRRFVAEALERRIPDRQQTTPPSWFRERAWDDGLDGAALAAARTALGTAVGSDGWAEDFHIGAELIRRRGSATDDVVDALTRMLAAGDGVDAWIPNGRHGLLLHLAWVLATWPEVRSADPATSVVLDLRSWNGLQGPPPRAGRRRSCGPWRAAIARWCRTPCRARHGRRPPQ